jgi:hypothetical protein
MALVSDNSRYAPKKRTMSPPPPAHTPARRPTTVAGTESSSRLACTRACARRRSEIRRASGRGPGDRASDSTSNGAGHRASDRCAHATAQATSGPTECAGLGELRHVTNRAVLHARAVRPRAVGWLTAISAVPAALASVFSYNNAVHSFTR